MPVALNSRLPNQITFLLEADQKHPWGMGWICPPSLEIKWEKERKCHAAFPYLARQLSVFRPGGTDPN